jgi:hypothetical protein
MSMQFGVGHPTICDPVESLSDVGCPDDDGFNISTMSPSFAVLARARSAKIEGCDGITHCLQVQTYSGEPFFPCNLACHLLAKDRWRSALADKALKDWPEVPLVVGSCLLSCGTEWLTWE